MCRWRFAIAVVFAFVTATAAGALAASPPSGTIECSVADLKPELGLIFRFPYLSGDPAPHGGIPTKATMVGPCDNAGVGGGKAPISHVEVKLVGRFAEGTTCDTLTSAPQVSKLALKIKWQTLNDAGHLKGVANSIVRGGSVSWDGGTEALVFASGPLQGAFAGSTATVTLTLDVGSVVSGDCPAYAGLFYGGDGESSITVP